MSRQSSVVFVFALTAAALGMSGIALRAAETNVATDDSAALFDKLDANHDGRLSESEIPDEKKRLFARLLRLAGKKPSGELTREEFVSQLKATNAAESPKTDSPDKSKTVDKPKTADKPKSAVDSKATGSPKPPVSPVTAQTEKPAIDPERIFDRLDAKHTGKVSVEDVPEDRREMLKKVLKEAGKSQNGSLDREEFVKAMKALLAKRAKAETAGATPAPKFGSGEFDVDQAVKRIMTLSKRSDGKLTIAEVPERLKDRFDKIDANHDGLVDEPELRHWLILAKAKLQAANNK